jgi:hypothetical protein
MSRRTLINLVLLGLITALALLFWWLQPTPLPALTNLQPEQIEEIRISDNKGRDLRLRKTASGWRLGQAPANARRIHQLLGICTTPSLQRFPAPQRLEEFGLQPAAIRLQLNRLELAFGGNDPLNGWRYVLIEDQIHLIGDGFQHHLTAPEPAFRQDD